MTGLVQWLWQGTLIACGLAVVLRWTPRINAMTRYTLWWAALIVVLLLPVGSAVDRSAIGRASGSVASDALVPVEAAWIELPRPPDWAISWAAGAWMGWVLLSFARLRQGVRAIARQKAHARPLPDAVARDLAARVDLSLVRRPATLRCSSSVTGACALGLTGPPTIVLSNQLIASLSADSLALIVRHEQAHLSRYDDWATLLQAALLAVTGLHPGIRLIARHLDRDREAACDDVVAVGTGEARRYAACLADAAEILAGRRAMRASLAPQACGRGSLRRRIERLLDGRVSERARVQPLAVATALMALTSAVTVALHTKAIEVEATPARQALALAVDHAETVAHVEIPREQPKTHVSLVPVVPMPEPPLDAARQRRVSARPVSATFEENGTTQASERNPASAAVTANADANQVKERASAPIDAPTAPVRSDVGPAVLPAIALPPIDPSLATGPASGARPWDAARAAGSAAADAGEGTGERLARAGTATAAASRRAASAVAGYFSRAGRAVASGF